MTTIRVAVVGCGSVSTKYIPHLKQSAAVELVAVCDTLLERASSHAEKYEIPHYFDDLDRMLAEIDFELLVNLTPMPFHGPFNRKGLEAGRNVWCEKPLATDLAEAYELLQLAESRQLGLYGAPNSPTSPSFRAMAEIVKSGEIGKVAVANGLYGWSGPTWPGTAWYYRKGGGALFDLGVYNITTITGLLGPARSVVAMAGAAVPERVVDGEKVQVEVEDTIALILDHGNAVYSVIQTGFVFGHQREEWTIQLIGTNGAMTMAGFDWEPRGVNVYVGDRAIKKGEWELRAEDQQGYSWEGGATYIAECMARGEKPVLTGAHALHTLEIMLGALKSAESGQKIALTSSFPWPLF